MMMDLVPDARTSSTTTDQSVNSPTGTTVAYSNAIVPNSSVDFTTDKNLVGLESEREENINWIARPDTQRTTLYFEASTYLLEMCLRISSANPNRRVSIRRRSDGFQSAHESSCIVWTECRSIQSKRRNWKMAKWERKKLEFILTDWAIHFVSYLIWTMGAHACTLSMHFHREVNKQLLRTRMMHTNKIFIYVLMVNTFKAEAQTTDTHTHVQPQKFRRFRWNAERGWRRWRGRRRREQKWSRATQSSVCILDK